MKASLQGFEIIHWNHFICWVSLRVSLSLWVTVWCWNYTVPYCCVSMRKSLKVSESLHCRVSLTNSLKDFESQCDVGTIRHHIDVFSLTESLTVFVTLWSCNLKVFESQCYVETILYGALLLCLSDDVMLELYNALLLDLFDGES